MRDLTCQFPLKETSCQRMAGISASKCVDQHQRLQKLIYTWTHIACEVYKGIQRARETPKCAFYYGSFLSGTNPPYRLGILRGKHHGTLSGKHDSPVERGFSVLLSVSCFQFTTVDSRECIPFRSLRFLISQIHTSAISSRYDLNSPSSPPNPKFRFPPPHVLNDVTWNLPPCACEDDGFDTPQ